MLENKYLIEVTSQSHYLSVGPMLLHYIDN